jgi:hypothetical protein
MRIYLQILKNIGQKALVIFPLPQSPHEVHSCFAYLQEIIAISQSPGF